MEAGSIRLNPGLKSNIIGARPVSSRFVDRSLPHCSLSGLSHGRGWGRFHCHLRDKGPVHEGGRLQADRAALRKRLPGADVVSREGEAYCQRGGSSTLLSAAAILARDALLHPGIERKPPIHCGRLRKNFPDFNEGMGFVSWNEPGLGDEKHWCGRVPRTGFPEDYFSNLFLFTNNQSG